MKKVLIIEDSKDFLWILKQTFSKQPFEVFFAEDGETAVAQAKLSKPDLVLMDLVMPGMNGFQATRAIAKDMETQHIPVIICSTKDQETDKIWGTRQGARGYVVKPVEAADLLNKIAALG